MSKFPASNDLNPTRPDSKTLRPKSNTDFKIRENKSGVEYKLEIKGWDKC